MKNMDFSLFAHNPICSFCLCMDMNYAIICASFTFSCSVRQESSSYKKAHTECTLIRPFSYVCISVSFTSTSLLPTVFYIYMSGSQRVGVTNTGENVCCVITCCPPQKESLPNYPGRTIIVYSSAAPLLEYDNKIFMFVNILKNNKR